MDPIVAVVTAAAGLFAGTNIDDIVVLAVLYIASDVTGRPRRWQIWVGQYAGIGVLTGISLVAAFGLTIVPRRWVWLLGWIPIVLGARKLVIAIRAYRRGERACPAVATGFAGVAGLTIANGGDNLAAYAPVFHTMSLGEMGLTVAVFAVLVAVWCAAGAWLVGRRHITAFVRRWGHWIIPVVYAGIGLYVFRKAGVLGP